MLTWFEKSKYPPVAQLDNATDSDSGERGFKSLRAGQEKDLMHRIRSFSTKSTLRVGEIPLFGMKYAYGV